MYCVSDDLALFFVFKQKTAYEMRISDWSSDVCSSDLAEHGERRPEFVGGIGRQATLRGIGLGEAVEGAVHGIDQGPYLARQAVGREAHGEVSGTDRRRLARGTGERAQAPCADEPDEDQGRSEEHTSELQSLMRNSYAVFCLKKKKKTAQKIELPAHVKAQQQPHPNRTVTIKVTYHTYIHDKSNKNNKDNIVQVYITITTSHNIINTHT